MDYKQIIRLRDESKEQLGGYHHPRTQPRKPLKVSTRQYAQELLKGRLTKRDIELSRALIGVGMLTRHQVQRLFFDDNAAVAANRLRKLYHYHFLDRSSYWLEDMGYEGFEPCYIYTIGTVGLEVFAMRLGISRDKVPFNPARYTLSREDHFLLHDLRISEMLTVMRLGAAELNAELLWFNETATTLRCGEEELVRPDGLGVIENKQENPAFFVEMDRGNTDWAQKVQWYERARVDGSWRWSLAIDGWRPERYPVVLCVVPGGLEEKVQKTIQAQKAQTLFYVKTWESFRQIGSLVRSEWYSSQTGKFEKLLP